MKPTEKHPAIEAVLDAQLPAGVSRRESIEANRCVSCREAVTGFRDAESEREYAISGLCQPCQDWVFRSDLEGGEW